MGKSINHLGGWIVARSTHLEAPHYDVQLAILAEVEDHIIVDRVDCEHEVQSVQQPASRLVQIPRKVVGTGADHSTAACEGSG